MVEGIPVLSVASMNGVSAEELRLAIQETVQKQQAVVNGLLNNISELLLGYNALAPVNNLPSEILTTVFSYASDSASSVCIICISHVCRVWRAIALQTPALWTRICLNDPVAIEAFLERSKSLPVTVSFKTSHTPVKTSLQLVMSSAHRLRGLNVEILPNTTGMENVINRIHFAAPILISKLYKVLPGKVAPGKDSIPEQAGEALAFPCLELPRIAWQGKYLPCVRHAGQSIARIGQAGCNLAIIFIVMEGTAILTLLR
ncbi:hypothetical protein C8Q70DRAFT_1024915 [Cubamyces menziesii]|nr:hypothetical protein C8Q70DRAFT_1024915 [Cubamyces menziesii]